MRIVTMVMEWQPLVCALSFFSIHYVFRHSLVLALKIALFRDQRRSWANEIKDLIWTIFTAIQKEKTPGVLLPGDSRVVWLLAPSRILTWCLPNLHLVLGLLWQQSLVLHVRNLSQTSEFIQIRNEQYQFIRTIRLKYNQECTYWSQSNFWGWNQLGHKILYFMQVRSEPRSKLALLTLFCFFVTITCTRLSISIWWDHIGWSGMICEEKTVSFYSNHWPAVSSQTIESYNLKCIQFTNIWQRQQLVPELDQCLKHNDSRTSVITWLV